MVWFEENSGYETEWRQERSRKERIRYKRTWRGNLGIKEREGKLMNFQRKHGVSQRVKMKG